MRLAVGARSWDLARLLLAESLGIGAAGCVGGLLVAGGCIRAFSIFPRLSVIPLASLDLRVDWRVCVIATSVTVISAVVFGLAPLRQSINLDLIAGLRSRSAAEGTARRGFLQMIQIGVALALLAGASLFLRTFRNAEAADPFLHSGTLMLANVDTNGPSGAIAFFDHLVEQIRALPGVQSAGAAWIQFSGHTGSATPISRRLERRFKVDTPNSFLQATGRAVLFTPSLILSGVPARRTAFAVPPLLPPCALPPHDCVHPHIRNCQRAIQCYRRRLRQQCRRCD